MSPIPDRRSFIVRGRSGGSVVIQHAAAADQRRRKLSLRLSVFSPLHAALDGYPTQTVMPPVLWNFNLEIFAAPVFRLRGSAKY